MPRVSNEKVMQAAKELEEIAILAKQMVIDLREGAPNPYTRVYWLRWRLGRIVTKMGIGVPSFFPSELAAIAKEYESYLQ